MGRAYSEIGNNGHAVDAFSATIAIDPQFTLLLDHRAEAYALLGEYELAVDDYSDTIRLSPSEMGRYVHRGVALFALGRLEEAIQGFDEAIDLYSSRIENLAITQNLPDRAARLKSGLALAHNNRGSNYQEAGKIDRAIDDYTEAIRLNPHLGEAFYNRGTVFAQLGKLAGAKQDLEQGQTLGIVIPK